ARIARGWTHRKLADHLVVKPQQVQRWENSDYDNISFTRLLEIADALEVELSESISLRRKAPGGRPCIARAELHDTDAAKADQAGASKQSFRYRPGPARG